MSGGALAGELRAQSALFVRAARTSFTYSSGLALSLLTAAIAYSVPMLVWRHVYATSGSSLPVPAARLFPYLLLAASLNTCFYMGVEWRVGQRIRLGLIATDLLRPIDFQLTQLSQALAEVALNATLVVPFFALAYVLWGGAALPRDGWCLLAFCVSVLFALLIHFALSFIFVQAAFVTLSNYGIFVAKSALQQAFSGLAAPLALFPPGLRAVAEYLPFCHTIHTPVSLYLGDFAGPALGHALLVQAAWAVGLLLGGRVLFTLSLRHLEIQGG